jgi:tripartite-type tricarboxylate transporter receptor subunit TctC
VDNRAGADGIRGAASFVRTGPGEALFFGWADLLTIAPLADDRLPYDPTADFVPISTAATDFFVLSVPAALPVRTLAEFVDYVRARPPREMNWASLARASPYPAFRAFLHQAGLEMNFVPYRGSPPALLDLADGRLHAVLSTLAPALAVSHGGRVRILATMARVRASAAPDVPTSEEAGFPGFWVEGLMGLFGWRGMSDLAREELSAQVRETLADSSITERFRALGMLARGSNPAAFAGELENHRVRWAELARQFGVRPPNG